MGNDTYHKDYWQNTQYENKLDPGFTHFSSKEQFQKIEMEYVKNRINNATFKVELNNFDFSMNTKKKVTIIGDSILARQCEENLKSFPYYIFKKYDININGFYSGTTDILTRHNILYNKIIQNSNIIIVQLQ